MTERKANEMVDEMAQEPTLDHYFNQNPANLLDDDLPRFVENERKRRAEFIIKDANK